MFNMLYSLFCYDAELSIITEQSNNHMTTLNILPPILKFALEDILYNLGKKIEEKYVERN